jgi:hypothetical protein
MMGEGMLAEQSAPSKSPYLPQHKRQHHRENNARRDQNAGELE